MKPYTLQRFYLEAKLLLEKYSFKMPQEWALECTFEIKERMKDEIVAPQLSCGIILKDYESDRTGKYVLFIYNEPTPESALSCFERAIIEKTGGKGVAINSVATEISRVIAGEGA